MAGGPGGAPPGLAGRGGAPRTAGGPPAAVRGGGGGRRAPRRGGGGAAEVRRGAASWGPRGVAPRTNQRSTRFFTGIVLRIIPVPYMRSATRCTWPTLRNVGYCPTVTRAASCADIPGRVPSADRTVPS